MDTTLNIKVNATIDDANINQVKTKLEGGVKGFEINPKIRFDDISKEINSLKGQLGNAAKLGVDDSELRAKFEKLKAEKISIQANLSADTVNTSAVKDVMGKAGSEGGTAFKEGLGNAVKGIEDKFKGMISPILSVFGGNILTKGVDGIVGSFGDLIEKGKASLTASANLSIAFVQAGKSGKELSASIAETTKFATELSNKYALSVAEVRNYSQAAAALTGATGQQNKDLTQLAIGIEKASNGMVSGEMAIRLFGKGVSDPESQFAMQRLTKQFPALGAAMKDIKDPTEATQKALEFFGPTFGEMAKQAEGPVGSMTRLQNSLNMIKSSLGKVVIEAVAPFIQSFASTLLPVIQNAVTFISSLTQYVKPLQPVFLTAGAAVGVLATSLLALSGAKFLTGLIADGVQFGLTILQKVVPSLVAQNAAQTGLIINTEALSVSTLKNIAISAYQRTASLALAATTGVVTAAQWAWNAAINANPISLIIIGVVALIGILVLLYKNVEVVQQFFDRMFIVIKAGFTAIWEGVKGVADGIGKLFTGDFSGAIESFGNIGKNASEKFNEELTKGAEKLNFEESQKKLDEAFSKGTEVNLKIKEQDNFNTLINQYKSAQEEIAALSSKATAGTISPEELKSLDELKSKSLDTAKAIGEIAPSVRENFKSVADSQGNLTQIYDINISKAQEFANTISLQGKEANVSAYSDSLIQQTKTIDSQIERQKALKSQIDITNDPQSKQELINKYNEENKLLDENKKKIIENAVKGAEAGLLTENAFEKIGQSINKTSAEVKNMALESELQKAVKAGTVNEKLITDMAGKYGLSVDAVQKIVSKTEEQKKAQENATAAVIQMSEALDSVNKKLKEGFDTSKNEAVFILSAKKMATKSKEVWDAWYNNLTAEQKKMADSAKNFSDKEIENKVNEAKQLKKTKEVWDETTKSVEKAAKLDDEKAKTSSKTKLDALDAYNNLVKTNKEKQESFVLDQETKRLQDGLKKSKIDDLLIEQNYLKLLENQNKTLTEIVAKKGGEISQTGEITFKGKIDKKTEYDIKQAALALKNDIQKSNNAIYTITAEIDQTQFEAEFAKKRAELETKKINISADIKAGKAFDFQATENDIELAKLALSKLNAELLIANKNNEVKISEEKKLEIEKTNLEILELQKKFNSELNINSIILSKSGAEQIRALALFEAQKTYDAELFAAQNNEQKIYDAKQKFADAKLKIEQAYWDKTATVGEKASKDLANSFVSAFTNIEIEPAKQIDTNAINDEYKKNRDALKASLSESKISYEQYVSDVKNLDKDKSEKLGEGVSNWKNVINSFNKTAVKAFETFRTSMNSRFEKIVEDASKTSDGLSNSMGKVYEQAAISSGAAMAQMLIDGKNFWKSMAGAAFQFLQTMIPIWGAQLIGGASATPQSILTGGGWALALYAGYNVLMQGLLAGIKSSLGFRTGGYTGDGSAWDVAGLVHKGEFVFTKEQTAIDRRHFEKMRSEGLTLAEYSNKYLPRNDVNNTALISAINEVRNENIALKREIKGLGSKFINKTTSTVKIETDTNSIVKKQKQLNRMSVVLC